MTHRTPEKPAPFREDSFTATALPPWEHGWPPTRQPANTAATAYTVSLNVNDISNLQTTLINNVNKYVNLNLSSNTITSIGDYAFAYCTGLASVTIPNGVTYIGYYAFQNCTGLTRITIPASIKDIGSEAFKGCTKLASVTIPSSVTYIGQEAFYTCDWSGKDSLTSVTFQGTITSGNFSNRAFGSIAIPTTYAPSTLTEA